MLVFSIADRKDRRLSHSFTIFSLPSVDGVPIGMKRGCEAHLTYLHRRKKFHTLMVVFFSIVMFEPNAGRLHDNGRK
jgi:hypothetical protein